MSAKDQMGKVKIKVKVTGRRRNLASSSQPKVETDDDAD